MHRGKKIGIVLCWSISGCSAAMSVYPKEGFVLDSLPPRDPQQVQVHFGQETPKCSMREIASVRYDAMRDGILTSQEVALKGLRKQAARIGAHGIYQLQFDSAGIVSSAIGTNLSGISIASGGAATEYSGQATAYLCIGPPEHDSLASARDKRGRSADSSGRYRAGPKVASATRNYFPPARTASSDVEHIARQPPPPSQTSEWIPPPGYYTPAPGYGGLLPKVEMDPPQQYKKGSKLRNTGRGLTIASLVLLPLGIVFGASTAGCGKSDACVVGLGGAATILSVPGLAMLSVGASLWAVGSSEMTKAQEMGYQPGSDTVSFNLESPGKSEAGVILFF